MDTNILAILVGVIVTYIHDCDGSVSCNGHFYKTELNSFYGRYNIAVDYHHDTYYSSYYYHYFYYYRYNNANYRFTGVKYCEDQCCTIKTYGSYSYKYCCTEYGITPSYKSSSRPSSTTGIIFGCTFGGILFVGFVIFSLFVLRCMWHDKKRIDPVTRANGLDNTTETVAMRDMPTKETSTTEQQYTKNKSDENSIV